MWYLRALTVAVVAGLLIAGTGCCMVSKRTYDRYVMAAQKKADAAQKQLEAKGRLLDKAEADLKVAQNQAADQKNHADQLQSQLAEAQKNLSAETTKVDKLQRDLDAQKAAKDQLAAKEAELTAAKNALAEITKKLEAAMNAMPATTPGR
jgi:chromosome segregation ATPase